MTHKNDTLFMTHRIEPLFKNHFSIWLKVLNSSNNSKNWIFFLNITQRIIPFFFEYDAKNWTLFWIWRKELNSLWTWLERIEPLFEYDSKNWISFWVWLKKSNFFFLNTTQKIEILVEKIVKTFKMVFLQDSKNRTRFSQYDSKNWTFFDLTQRFYLFSLTPRIELFFWLGLTELDPFSWIWLRELKFSWFFSCLQELNFFQKWRRELDPFSLNLTQRIEPFSDMTQRVGPFFLNMTWRIQPFVYHDSKELNLSFVKIWFKYLNLRLSMTQRSEPSFMNFTQRIELFFVNMTHRSESFFAHDSKKWTFLNITQRIEPFFLIRRKELNFFLNLTQRIDPFYDSKNRTFFLKMTQRIELFLF